VEAGAAEHHWQRTIGVCLQKVSNNINSDINDCTQPYATAYNACTITNFRLLHVVYLYLFWAWCLLSTRLCIWYSYTIYRAVASATIL